MARCENEHNYKKTPSFPLIEVDNENFGMGLEGLVKKQCESNLVVNTLVGISNTIKKLVNIAWVSSLQQLKQSKKNWSPNNKISLPRPFFLLNDDGVINVASTQTMCFVVNHYVLQAQNPSSNTKEKRCFIYYKDHGTTIMKKHIISKNHDFYKRRGQERSKQQTCLSHNVITKHFGSTNPYKDQDATQK
jgi:hypothetical protein